MVAGVGMVSPVGGVRLGCHADSGMRVASGETWYQAHRSHAYQRLVQMGLGHRRLALWVGLVNVLVLWPVAYLVQVGSGLSLVLVVAVSSAMAFTWWRIQRAYRFSSAESPTRS